MRSYFPPRTFSIRRRSRHRRRRRRPFNSPRLTPTGDGHLAPRCLHYIVEKMTVNGDTRTYTVQRARARLVTRTLGR